MFFLNTSKHKVLTQVRGYAEIHVSPGNPIIELHAKWKPVRAAGDMQAKDITSSTSTRLLSYGN